MSRAQSVKPLMSVPLCSFSDAPVVQAEAEDAQVDTQESLNARVGADETFSERKHAYVLTFPWNYPQIVDRYSSQFPGLSDSSYWARYVENSRATVDFNKLFRNFHQCCALPDVDGLKYYCEGKLATVVGSSVDRIHFHGLDIEMANLTVEQPSIKVLKVEINHGINFERDSNGSEDRYNVSTGSILGAPTTYYTPKEEFDTRHWLDCFEDDHRPYNICVTTMIESPMKLYVQNQNYSSILFGSKDEESVKNVVRFEANVRGIDLFNMLPIDNKKSLDWKITDFNDIMNGNPHFE